MTLWTPELGQNISYEFNPKTLKCTNPSFISEFALNFMIYFVLCVFNATFKHCFWAILLGPFKFVEEAGVPGENHQN